MFLSKQDQDFLARGILGQGPKLVSIRPMIRKQGNGNYTGFVVETYSDGSTISADFVTNAKTMEDVRESWVMTGWEKEAA